jgi:Zinc finger C-x8-C-x5-C-x3-H type (and similar)
MTGYHQVPRQSSFFQLNSELDPWTIKANENIHKTNYGGWDNKAPHSPPSLFDEQDWSPPVSPPSSPPNIAAIKKSLIKAQQLISTASHADPWTIYHDSKELPPSVIEDEITQQNLYKTELCRSFMETHTCRYGVKCQFAHGKHELRPVVRHPKYKTEICKTFHTLGTCPYGIRCRFIHTRPSDDTHKSKSLQTSPAHSPPSSPSMQDASPPEVLRWSTSWSSLERSLPSSPEDTEVPDLDQPARRLPIFRRIC